jgi:hypothetical protein
VPVEFLGIAATNDGSEIGARSGANDFLERGSALVGSPQQVIEKISRYHGAFGNRLISLAGHRGNLSQAQFTGSLELFQAEVAPAVRLAIPDPPWPETALAKTGAS